MEPGTYARFDTTEGSFTVRLFDKEAPNTVANFVGLAEGTKEWRDPASGDKKKAPYYDGVIFHRVINGFMIQGGDRARHRHRRAGLQLRRRVPPVAAPHGRRASSRWPTPARTPTAASSSSRSVRRRTSTTATTVFGEVVEGLDVVKKIGAVPTGRQDRPVKPVVMNQVTIKRVA